jgi:hypothetical protein
MADKSMSFDRNSSGDSASAGSQRGADLEARITLALETAPTPSIPAGFAARVAAELPAPLPASLNPPRYGRAAAIACVPVLLALIFLFAQRPAVASPLWIATESLLCALFAMIAVWLALRDVRSPFGWPS